MPWPLCSLGANLDVDVPIKYLGLFLEDAAVYEDVCVKYASGEMTSGEVKALAAKVVTAIVTKHQTARACVTDADVAQFMATRPLFE